MFIIICILLNLIMDLFKATMANMANFAQNYGSSKSKD